MICDHRLCSGWVRKCSWSWNWRYHRICYHCLDLGFSSSFIVITSNVISSSDCLFKRTLWLCSFFSSIEKLNLNFLMLLDIKLMRMSISDSFICYFPLLINNIILIAGPRISNVNDSALIRDELISANASNKASKWVFPQSTFFFCLLPLNFTFMPFILISFWEDYRNKVVSDIFCTFFPLMFIYF